MRCRTAGVANFALLVSLWLSRFLCEDSVEADVFIALASVLLVDDDDDDSDDGGDVRELPDPSSRDSSPSTPISGPVKLASLGSISL